MPSTERKHSEDKDPLDSTRRLLPRRLGLALLSVVTTLILIEAILQILHAVVVTRPGRYDITDPDAPSILCLGDSHTYGFGVDADETYPAQLEKKLRGKGYRVNVVNLGVPGMNTSEIRRATPVWLDQYRPLAVIILASVNNGWNIEGADWSDARDGLPVPLSRRIIVCLQSNVRLIRGLSILARRIRSTRSEETAFDRHGNRVMHNRLENWESDRSGKPANRVLRDFTAMVTLVRTSGAAPFLMTYIGPDNTWYEVPNMLLRKCAADNRVALIDNYSAMIGAFSREDGTPDKEMIERIFLPDRHLTAEGYDLLTDNILAALVGPGVLEHLPRAEGREDRTLPAGNPR